MAPCKEGAPLEVLMSNISRFLAYMSFPGKKGKIFFVMLRENARPCAGGRWGQKCGTGAAVRHPVARDAHLCTAVTAGSEWLPVRFPLARAQTRRAAFNGLVLRFVVCAALCLQGTGMLPDTIGGLHNAQKLASFSHKRPGNVKFKGKPDLEKLRAPIRAATASKRGDRTSTIHLRRMLRQAENATVMQQGCDVMWKICLNANEQDTLGRTKGACAAVAVTLKRHSKEEPTVLSALKLACNLCYAQPKNPFGFAGWAHTHSQNELGGKQGAISDIVHAMGAHVASAEVQNAGIRALSNLVYNHTENALRATRDRGIETVLAAMKAHPEEMLVQEAGCTFVWSILASIQNESYITYGLEMTGAPGAGQVAVNLSVAGRLAELGAVPVLVHALDAYGGVTEFDREGVNVGEQGCAALWFLSVRPGRLRNSIVEAGGEAVARRVLHSQAEVPPARTWAARLLQQLTGKDFSSHFMPMQVPGPDAMADAVKQVTECVYECPYYCGCNDTWGINRPPKNVTGATGKKGAAKKAKNGGSAASPQVAATTFRDAKTKAATATARSKVGPRDGTGLGEREDRQTEESSRVDIDFSSNQLEGSEADRLRDDDGGADGRGRGGEGVGVDYSSDDDRMAQLDAMEEKTGKIEQAKKFMATAGKKRQKDEQTKQERRAWERQRQKIKQNPVGVARATKRRGFTPLGEEDTY